MEINLKEGEIKKINQMLLYTLPEGSMKLKQKTAQIVKKIHCAKYLTSLSNLLLWKFITEA